MRHAEPARAPLSIRRAPALDDLEAITARESRHRHEPHSHATFVIQAVDRGAVAFECEGRRHEAPAGTLIVLAPDAVHDGRPSGREPISYRSLYPSPRLVAEALGVDCGAPPPRFPSPVVRDRALVRLARAAHGAVFGGADPLRAGALVARLLGELVRRHAVSRRDTRSAGPTPRAAVRRAIEFVESSFTHPITLADIARAAGASPFHLVRAFRADTGLTPHAYVLDRRVRLARALLRDGMPIAGAAIRAGFCDQSHLNRRFKSLTGVTPGRYR